MESSLAGDLSQACEGVYKSVSNRLYDLNKRIGTAQKSIALCEQKMVAKQRHLYSADAKELVEEKSGRFYLHSS